MQCSLTSCITLLQPARWLDSGEQKAEKPDQRVCPEQTEQEPLNHAQTTPKKSTCGYAVVLQDLAEDQFVGVQGEWVPEHADRDEVHVTVGAFGLERAGAIEVPFGNI